MLANLIKQNVCESLIIAVRKFFYKLQEIGFRGFAKITKREGREQIPKKRAIVEKFLLDSSARDFFFNFLLDRILEFLALS